MVCGGELVWFVLLLSLACKPEAPGGRDTPCSDDSSCADGLVCLVEPTDTGGWVRGHWMTCQVPCDVPPDCDFSDEHAVCDKHSYAQAFCCFD